MQAVSFSGKRAFPGAKGGCISPKRTFPKVEIVVFTTNSIVSVVKQDCFCLKRVFSMVKRILSTAKRNLSTLERTLFTVNSIVFGA
jgi:hypothetical protein